jgi:hypothetical protein
MAILRYLLRALRAVVRVPLRALRAGARKVLLSARVWVLFILLVIAVLVGYYVESNRHTPFTWKKCCRSGCSSSRPTRK